eukprot:gene3980-18300_t
MSAKRLPTQALPVQAVGFENFPQPAPVPVATAAANYVSRNELSELRQDMLAVMDARLKQNFQGKGGPNYFPPRHGQKGVLGRNLRAMDGQPICNKCPRVGHVACYCPESNQSFNKSQNQSFRNGQQHLNGIGPFRNVLIWGIVEKQNFKLLVDTGAAVTVISDKFYNAVLRVAYRVRQQESLNSVKTADGKEAPVIGAVLFPILVGSVSYQCHAFVVAGLAYKIVLGRDFFHEYGAVIDVRQQFVDFSGKNKINFASGEYPPLISDVRVSKTFVIDAQSELVIQARLEKFATSYVVGLIEAVPKLSDCYHLYGACSLSSPNENGKVTFRLLNPSDTPVILYKGSTVGRFHQITSPDDIISLESKEVSSMEAPSQSQYNSSPREFSLQFKSLP